MQKINKIHAIPSLRFFDRQKIDIIELLPVIPKGNRYIIVTVEYSIYLNGKKLRWLVKLMP